jgi:carboxyl-terminal processing protease
MIPATLLLAACLFAPPKLNDCERDVEFALDTLEQKCGHFFATKGIDWKVVAKDMRAAAKAAKDDSAHYGVLIRLVAALHDGHAYVKPVAKDGSPRTDVEPPEEFTEQLVAPGMHLTQNTKTKKVFVKASWGAAERAGIAPGMEVVSVDGKTADAWLVDRVEYWRSRRSLATDAHAKAFALSRGLAMPRGTKLKLSVRGAKGSPKAIQLALNADEDRRVGPAVPPKDLALTSELGVGKTPGAFGYVHIPKIFDDLPQRMDAVLATIAQAKGLVLDFRGNSGGGCDHDQLLGLFVAKGKHLNRPDAGPLPSFGENPFSGPIVVIVDGMVVSAGETASGMFKEDGRGTMIGDDHTAGMSGAKEDIALPSEKFLLHVVVRSFKNRFNDGKGVEGVGVIPNEIVPYDPADLAKGVDTLIARADAILAKQK